jgi:hypothetical protein
MLSYCLSTTNLPPICHEELTSFATVILAVQFSTTEPIASQAFAPTGLVKHYMVERAATAIVIDGHLDEFAWQATAQINGFDRILHSYNQVLYSTRARMLWDDENLYVAFVCQDPNMWATYENEDDPLWEEEVVEVFIDPDGDGRNCLELEVNPHNTVVDLNIVQLRPSWKANKDWDAAGLKTAVETQGTVNDSLDQDQGWTVEIAIPWAAMAAGIGGGGRPDAGDMWRLNLYRIERKAGWEALRQIRSLRAQIEQMTPALGEAQQEQLQEQLSRLTAHFEDQTEYTAWSETYQRGFHHPERFGMVQFAQ